MSELQPQLITVKETAEYLRIPLPTVYYLVQRGQLPAIQIGGRWRIKKDQLDRLYFREGELVVKITVLVVSDDASFEQKCNGALTDKMIDFEVVSSLECSTKQIDFRECKLVLLDVGLFENAEVCAGFLDVELSKVNALLCFDDNSRVVVDDLLKTRHLTIVSKRLDEVKLKEAVVSFFQ